LTQSLFGTELEESDGEPISLSALEFDVLWEHLDLGEQPLILTVPSPGKTDEERAEFVQQAWSSMFGRGLGGPRSVHPELERLVRLLERPHREVDARVVGGRAMAAAVGEEAVLATYAGDTVTVRATSASSLASTMTGLLPVAPAGPGRSVSLPTADFEAAAKAGGADKVAFEQALYERGIRGDDVANLLEMIKDVTATGNFGCAMRDSLGKRRRAERVVAYFDTEDGRYANVRKPGVDGSLWTTLSPADTRRLTGHVQSMIDELAAQVEG
jgi:hypothetical protein